MFFNIQYVDFDHIYTGNIHIENSNDNADEWKRSLTHKYYDNNNNNITVAVL